MFIADLRGLEVNILNKSAFPHLMMTDWPHNNSKTVHTVHIHPIMFLYQDTSSSIANHPEIHLKRFGQPHIWLHVQH